MSIKDFLHAAVADKPTAALDAFSKVMDDKLESALEVKEKEVARNLFQSTPDEDEE